MSTEAISDYVGNEKRQKYFFSRDTAQIKFSFYLFHYERHDPRALYIYIYKGSLRNVTFSFRLRVNACLLNLNYVSEKLKCRAPRTLVARKFNRGKEIHKFRGIDAPRRSALRDSERYESNNWRNDFPPMR